MTIVTPTGITGINSITSLVDDITFSTASGSGANANVNNLQASSVRLNGSTSGYVDLTAPAVAGSNNLVLPTGNGTADQVLAGNGSGALSFVDRGRMVLETAKASTSGTSVDFTGIPSWVKKITVMFDGVSTNGSSSLLIQIGDSGGIENTGYLSGGANTFGANSTGTSNSTAGFIIVAGSASHVRHGHMVITNISTTKWVSSHSIGISDGSGGGQVGAGTKTLSDPLDRVRITTVNGTDTFDAGSVNILLEG
jgi:hypothetical protein